MAKQAQAGELRTRIYIRRTVKTSDHEGPVLHIVYANDLVGDGVAQLIDETVRPDQRRIPHCQGGGLLHLELHGGKDLRAVGIDPFAC